MDEKCSFDYYEASQMFHGSMTDIMGTRFDIVLVGKSRQCADTIWLELINELKKLEHLFNRFDKSSEVSRINNDAKNGFVSVNPEMWAVLQDCKRYYDLTLGLFDITKKDFSKVCLRESDNAVSFLSDDISLDFGGYAKGYALRKIQYILHENNVKQCFVDFGNSSILCIGTHPYGDSWKVSIENPYCKGEIADEISLRDEAMSVSGNTPHYSGHIVHPVSGEQNEMQKAVCVIAKNPLDAEVLTTTVMIASPEEKDKIVKQFNIKSISEYDLQTKENV